MRFYTVPTAKEARRSVVWAIGLIGAFYLFTLTLGYGAAALVGPDTILKGSGGQNSAAPLLAFQLGGVVLLGIISAVAFATILAVVAGLTITASASFAHDIYASVIQNHRVTGDEQVRVSRIAAVVLGIAAIGLGILANGREHRVPWWRWRSRWRPRPTCRPSCTRCTGGGSTPAAPCGTCTAADQLHRADRLLPGGVGHETSMLPGETSRVFPLSTPGIVSIRWRSCWASSGRSPHATPAIRN